MKSANVKKPAFSCPMAARTFLRATEGRNRAALVRTLNQSWRDHGFGIDMTELAYLGDRNDVVAYLNGHGWDTVGTSTAELFVANKIHLFYSMDYAGRRDYSEQIATNVFGEPMAFKWPNWTKLFFNNKGVAAHTTDVCAQYPPDDQSVWNW